MSDTPTKTQTPLEIVHRILLDFESNYKFDDGTYKAYAHRILLELIPAVAGAIRKAVDDIDYAKRARNLVSMDPEFADYCARAALGLEEK